MMSKIKIGMLKKALALTAVMTLIMAFAAGNAFASTSVPAGSGALLVTAPGVGDIYGACDDPATSSMVGFHNTSGQQVTLNDSSGLYPQAAVVPPGETYYKPLNGAGEHNITWRTQIGGNDVYMYVQVNNAPQGENRCDFEQAIISVENTPQPGHHSPRGGHHHKHHH